MLLQPKLAPALMDFTVVGDAAFKPRQKRLLPMFFFNTSGCSQSLNLIHKSQLLGMALKSMTIRRNKGTLHSILCVSETLNIFHNSFTGIHTIIKSDHSAFFMFCHDYISNSTMYLCLGFCDGSCHDPQLFFLMFNYHSVLDKHSARKLCNACRI